MSAAISGPCACPVTALRSGMNRPRPLRPVATFTAPVQVLQVSASNGPSGSKPMASATKSRSSSSITGSAPSRHSAHQAPRSCSVSILSRITVQNGAARSAGTPSASMSPRTASKGKDCKQRPVSGNKSASSNLVGAEPKCPISKPSINSAISARNSTGSDEPNRAIRLSKAIGCTPRSRKSRRAKVPRRFDSASPCGPVSSEWWAKLGTEPPSASMI
mmetsp:Transcript_27238/g.49864  ORF Transcript_27238/g.49864 Transcript_27238/m.49864 type:complete len:218 (-) Transcript_27238:1223-1876(-)